MKSGPIAGFKAYDLRGRIPSELNEDVAYRVGRAYAQFVRPGKVIVGRDIRLSSEELSQALEQGLLDSGVDVYDIGLCGTEDVYFATFSGRHGRRHHGDGQPQPARLQRHEVRARGIAPDQRRQRPAGHPAHRRRRRSSPRRHGSASATRWTSCRLTSSTCCPTSIVAKLKPLKVVVNAGNGGAGLIIDKLQPFLPFEFIKVQHEPDGSFPNGVPNPMLVENHRAPIEALRAHGADLAVPGTATSTAASCSTSAAEFIEGYYIVGLLAEASCAAIRAAPSSTTRASPGTRSTSCARRRAGRAVQVRACLHQGADARGGRRLRRRDERAPLFPRFRLLRQRHDPVAAGHAAHGRERPAAVGAGRRADPALSGQRRDQSPGPRRGGDASSGCSRAIGPRREATTSPTGVGLEFAGWRFNLRTSNTEPLIRLNVESRGDDELMRRRTSEILDVMGGKPG